MKTLRAKRGPFTEQPFYEPGEIESICTTELQKVGLYPSRPEPIRIDRFIEKRFGIVPTYDELPEGLLGFTTFSSKGVEEIVVARSLDGEGTRPAERRLRTTLAHEGGHGLLHAHLFVLDPRPVSLFGDGIALNGPKILCREGGISGVEALGAKPRYRWYEFQANKAMAALLLPKALVEMALSSVLERRGLLGLPSLPGNRRESAARLLASTFEVNPVVARLCLDALFPSAAGAQLTL